jgi:hypothetical protein
VIGGLLMALTDIQALSYTVPLHGPLRGPVIALLGSLAVALPILVPRWRLGDLPPMTWRPASPCGYPRHVNRNWPGRGTPRWVKTLRAELTDSGP